MNEMKLKIPGMPVDFMFRNKPLLGRLPRGPRPAGTGAPLDSGPPFLMCFGHNRNRVRSHPLGNLGIDVHEYTLSQLACKEEHQKDDLICIRPMGTHILILRNSGNVHANGILSALPYITIHMSRRKYRFHG
ncbi:uncharacterized protein CLUP02_10069 [Colletotrichum lupini]|uniref:Uncharacterized protein n=1 Tax=Colletotrichum lupini TaxID=145971 RepID=A0A9Q8SXR8_9PEZI|nr:uncharacterized protein CLUP02_10069 [Colletotrichum lupini]UQC84572.1 hypothetical protein CLUP02_10069 [Colletotrichum lupini]